MSEIEEKSDNPFAESEAAQMLSAALDESGLSTREVARRLGYKATVVISHMATGRVPIPLDKAADIAKAVSLDPSRFVKAVMVQRHPDAAKFLSSTGTPGAHSDPLCAELTLLAGCDLSELSDDHKKVLREVVADKSPARRWLSLAELPTILMLRGRRPRMSESGIPAGELALIQAALD